MEDLGCSIDQRDIQYSSNHDFTSVKELENVRRDLRSGKFHSVHLGTECTTFSRICSPPYRDANGEELAGLTPSKESVVVGMRSMSIE